MNKLSLVLLALITFSLISCDSTQKSEKYIKGYKTKIHNSTGGAMPQIGEYVFFNLDISNDKGEIIDQSDRGDNMPVIQILAEDQIPDKSNPVIELMSNLAVGDSASLFIPIDSIPNPPPNMAGSAHIEYSVKTVKIQSEESYQAELEEKRMEMEKAMAAAKLQAPKILAEIETTIDKYLKGGNVGEVREGPNGLKVIILEEGTGENAKKGQGVAVMYAGYLKNMNSFDNSYNRGMPYEFMLGQGSVISGWDEGLALINKGTKALLDIPYAMAYGEQGRPPTIPAKSDLIFHVTLEDIK